MYASGLFQRKHIKPIQIKQSTIGIQVISHVGRLNPTYIGQGCRISKRVEIKGDRRGLGVLSSVLFISILIPKHRFEYLFGKHDQATAVRMAIGKPTFKKKSVVVVNTPDESYDSFCSVFHPINGSNAIDLDHGSI